MVRSLEINWTRQSNDVTSAGTFALLGSAFLPWWLYFHDCKMATVAPNLTCSHQIQWCLPAPVSLVSEWLWSCYPHVSKRITVSGELGYALWLLPDRLITWASIHPLSACSLLGAGDGISVATVHLHSQCGHSLCSFLLSFFSTAHITF